MAKIHSANPRQTIRLRLLKEQDINPKLSKISSRKKSGSVHFISESKVHSLQITFYWICNGRNDNFAIIIFAVQNNEMRTIIYRFFLSWKWSSYANLFADYLAISLITYFFKYKVTGMIKYCTRALTSINQVEIFSVFHLLLQLVADNRQVLSSTQ